MTHAAIAFLVALVVVPLIRVVSARLRLYDMPNARSSHTIPTPRIGGAGIVAGIAVSCIIAWDVLDRSAIALLLAGAVLFIVNIVDDVRGLPEWLKFIVQSVVIALVVSVAGIALSTLRLTPEWTFTLAVIGFGLSWFWMMAVSNAFNFMDGINGIAASEAILCGATYGVMAARSELPAVAVLAFAVAGGAAGFLLWNVRGWIFMGDLGSVTLGLLLSGVALLLVVRSAATALAVLLPLLPFLLDTGVTLTRRIVRGERFFSAHRTHYYQRLVTTGWSHLSVTALWSLLAAAGSLLALRIDGMSTSMRALSVVALLMLHFAVAALVYMRERRTLSS